MCNECFIFWERVWPASVYSTLRMPRPLNPLIHKRTSLILYSNPNQGHNSSHFHSPFSSPLSPFSTTNVYSHRLAFAGSLISNCSTSSGLIITTLKFDRAIGSCRSSTFCPSWWSWSGSCPWVGVPGGGFRQDPMVY